MTRFSAWRAIGGGGAALLAAFGPAACGGTEEHPREGTGGAGASAGVGGMTAAGTGGAPSGAGGMAGADAATCSGVGKNALITTFDEGAVIADRNYPITGGAMPGGTYAYADPNDTGMAFSLSVVPDGHTCKALAMSITGSSFRGMGLWSTASVNATEYTGITFWARRGPGSTDPIGLEVNLGLDAVTASEPGGTGTCVPATTEGDCVRPHTTIALSDVWTEYALPWSTFTPGVAGGDPVPASGVQVNGLDFSFQLAVTGMQTTVLELDDVAFLAAP